MMASLPIAMRFFGCVLTSVAPPSCRGEIRSWPGAWQPLGRDPCKRGAPGCPFAPTQPQPGSRVLRFAGADEGRACCFTAGIRDRSFGATTDSFQSQLVARFIGRRRCGIKRPGGLDGPASPAAIWFLGRSFCLLRPGNGGVAFVPGPLAAASSGLAGPSRAGVFQWRWSARGKQTFSPCHPGRPPQLNFKSHTLNLGQTGLGERIQIVQLGLEFELFLDVHAVHEKDAVQMVHFVLNGPGKQSLAPELN